MIYQSSMTIAHHHSMDTHDSIQVFDVSSNAKIPPDDRRLAVSSGIPPIQEGGGKSFRLPLDVDLPANNGKMVDRVDGVADNVIGGALGDTIAAGIPPTQGGGGESLGSPLDADLPAADQDDETESTGGSETDSDLAEVDEGDADTECSTSCNVTDGAPSVAIPVGIPPIQGRGGESIRLPLDEDLPTDVVKIFYAVGNTSSDVADGTSDDATIAAYDAPAAEANQQEGHTSGKSNNESAGSSADGPGEPALQEGHTRGGSVDKSLEGSASNVDRGPVSFETHPAAMEACTPAVVGPVWAETKETFRNLLGAGLEEPQRNTGEAFEEPQRNASGVLKQSKRHLAITDTPGLVRGQLWESYQGIIHGYEEWWTNGKRKPRVRVYRGPYRDRVNPRWPGTRYRDLRFVT